MWSLKLQLKGGLYYLDYSSSFSVWIPDTSQRRCKSVQNWLSVCRI